MTSQIERSNKLISNCDKLQQSLTQGDLFANANRQRTIQIEQQIKARWQTLEDEVLTKINEIDELHKLCSEINLYNEEEKDKLAGIYGHNNNINNESVTNFPITNNENDDVWLNEKENLQLLVIGSSIMKYIDASKIEKRLSTKARMICIPSAKTEDASKKLEELSKTHNIKILMIHVGRNNIPNDNPQFDILNTEISEEELTEAIKNMKSGKAPVEDQVTNGMIKEINKEGIALLLRLIHKDSDPDDENNYRAITLNSCIGKLFCTILNQRFSSRLEAENILRKEQAGFRKNCRTTDQIFLLRNLVRRYIANNKYLCTCFVDFSKAFDSIWRKVLIEKLQRIGVSGKFLKIIKSIYGSTTNSIIYGDQISNIFKSNMGVEQGDTLSTTLFNIFLNDLPNEFKFDGNGPVTVGDVEISCLLYADDLVLMSTSSEALQRCITRLEQYCERWKLEVNLKKTKILIFNKQGALIKKHKFYFKKHWKCKRI